MKGWIVAATAALAFAITTTPVHADPGGRGLDHGDADRPHDRAPEASAVDYPGAKWLAAHKSNYTNANRPKSDPITTVVVHTTQGSYEGTKAWFRNPKSQVTTHYVIRSKDGEITQMVHEADIAWHAGNWDVNTRSIGIEHEGYVDNPKKWYTDAMYRSSAKLVAAICDKYRIPVDRKHIIGHVEVPGADHTDPGKGWDWNKYLTFVRDAMEPKPAPIKLNNETHNSTASGAWQSRHQGGDYGPDYAYASPVAKSDPFWYDATIPARGRYRVEVWFPADARHNARTPYILNTAGDGPWQTVYVDQRTGGGAWQTIGTFDFDAGSYQAVAVSRWTDGTGLVVADGVKLTRE
ncbi:N-acetylmuramoyl-L-alanine amidase [Stackebrandtia soli]|uniref:golvesin C-terminal-like domain-containing protein n=1 Tax=Stackebrandtia soli TaxID=1892856 RepID=UPI0039E77458